MKKGQYQPIPVSTSSEPTPARKLPLLRLVLAAFGTLFVLLFLGHSCTGGQKTHHRSVDSSAKDMGWSFEVVQGFFAQTDPATSPIDYDVYHEGRAFGRLAPSWQDFEAKIQRLAQTLDADEQIKVIFAARHGQGYHNVAESQYGTEKWDCYWAMLDGDGKLHWGPDADLTALGKSQAEVAHYAWMRELTAAAPFPDAFISSPMTRAMDTSRITWKDLGKFKPVVMEQWRETIGLHTCDKRRPASYIRKAFPEFAIEAGFSEEDLLWTKDTQETPDQTDVRIRKALEAFFDSSRSLYVSITAHSGVHNSLLRVVGHQPFPLLTGGMIPIVVKGKRVPSKALPTQTGGPSATAPPCPSKS